MSTKPHFTIILTVKEVDNVVKPCGHGASCRCNKETTRTVDDVVNIVVQADTLPKALVKAQKYLEVEASDLFEEARDKVKALVELPDNPAEWRGGRGA